MIFVDLEDVFLESMGLEIVEMYAIWLVCLKDFCLLFFIFEDDVIIWLDGEKLLFGEIWEIVEGEYFF